MVVNGATGPGKSANTVEVIDLRSNQQESCTIPDFPDPNMASFGGLVNDSIPMVCGGVIPPSSSCYFLIKGSWQQGELSKLTHRNSQFFLLHILTHRSLNLKDQSNCSGQAPIAIFYEPS